MSMKPSCIAALYKNGAVLNAMCHGRSAIHEAMLLNGSKVKEYAMAFKFHVVVFTYYNSWKDDGRTRSFRFRQTFTLFLFNIDFLFPPPLQGLNIVVQLRIIHRSLLSLRN
ncbi:unnamed protein product [Soboliphyme baturini]|uniref:ANK_REP_REGION domain-containing protein n=1 Tax=Soboliphyme baturini TaxID=241478 RepID=A0A183J3Z8_9BILA|nr:unnamed protein product [Soboliphyme baturini]